MNLLAGEEQEAEDCADVGDGVKAQLACENHPISRMRCRRMQQDQPAVELARDVESWLARLVGFSESWTDLIDSTLTV